MISVSRKGRLQSASVMATLALLLTPQASQTIELDRADVEDFVTGLVSDHQFDRAYVRMALSNSKSKESIIEAISRPAEKTKPWFKYREIFITPQRIQAGTVFWRKHRETLEEIELETGVSAAMIVGIIGVESYYGRRTGDFRVIDALATLAFDYPPRSKFFRSELTQFFLLTREEQFNLRDLKGSYAGAMGPPQFIPSSYRHYAVDGNGDGQRNLFTDWDDILTSVANYFVEHGWKSGQPVATKGTLGSSTRNPPVNNGLKPKETVTSLSKQGVMFSTELGASAPAQLIRLEGRKDPEYWVGFHNFYVITRYNRSIMYALAAHQLGQAVSESANPATVSATVSGDIVDAGP